MKRIFVIGILAAIVLASASLADAQTVDCQMCHPQLAEGKSVHAAVGMGCNICHVGVDASEIPHKFTSGFDRGLSSEPPQLCFGCHGDSQFTGKKTVHMPVAGGMCTTCHSPHSSSNDKLLQSENVCLNCHDSSMFNKATPHPPAAAGMCSACHEPHQSDNVKLLKQQPPDLCYNCHQKENFYGPTIHAPVGIGACFLCHDPHSSDNAKLLYQEMSGLCFQCHDQADFAKATVHAPVKQGKCITCHRPHVSENEFLLKRRGNFLCRSCHAGVERTPHGIVGFTSKGHPLRGRRDPVREGKTFGCQSCHLPHTSEWPSLWRYKANSVFELCSYCHKM